MNPRETVAFWLDYTPTMWSRATYSILIEELEHGLPPYLTIAERDARLQALYQLTGRNGQGAVVEPPKKRTKR